jgi:hypothetical protein
MWTNALRSRGHKVTAGISRWSGRATVSLAPETHQLIDETLKYLH